MEAGNTSKFSEFFVGLTNDPQLQPIFFALFFLIYAVTVVGNLALASPFPYILRKPFPIGTYSLYCTFC